MRYGERKSRNAASDLAFKRTSAWWCRCYGTTQTKRRCHYLYPSISIDAHPFFFSSLLTTLTSSISAIPASYIPLSSPYLHTISFCKRLDFHFTRSFCCYPQFDRPNQCKSHPLQKPSTIFQLLGYYSDTYIDRHTNHTLYLRSHSVEHLGIFTG